MINKLFNHKSLQLKFRRFEFKYQLPQYLADKIAHDLSNYMEYDLYAQDKPDKSYQVSSLYLDTAGLGCYYDKLAGLRDRKKLRLRTYQTSLNPDTTVFVEIKRKNGPVVLKDRIVSDLKTCQKYINQGSVGGFIKDESDIQDKEVLKEFFWTKNYNCLVPKVMVTYKRMPMIDKLNPKFRVTFDSQIKAYPANYLFFSEEPLEVFPHNTVMELKYNNVVPAWFHSIIKKYQINIEPFSKYCQSLETCHKHYKYV